VKISCPNCAAAYELDDSRVPTAGLSIKCPKCKKPFTVHRPKADGAKDAGRPAVPLPGQAGGKPAGSKLPAARPTIPAKPGRGGPVPLPGQGEAAAGAAPSPLLPDLDPPATPGAVALPGLDEPQRTAIDFRPRPPAAAPPREGADAVPLPGFDGARASPPPPPADDPFAAIDVDNPASGGAPPSPPSQSQGGDDAFAADLPEIPAPPPPSSAAKQEEAMNFDFVESKPKSPSAPDMLDFVDDAPKDPDKKKRPPPPVVGKPGGAGSEETLDFADDPGAGAADGARSKKAADKEQKKREREERAAREREERARRKEARGSGTGQTGLRSVMRPGPLILLVLVLGIGAVGALGYRARRTPAGLFWMNLYLPPKKAVTAAEAKVIEQGLVKLNRADFTGAREAVAAAAELMTVVPDDDDVKSFFVLAASELKIEYGQVGADWDQAKGVVERIKGTRPPQNRARGAFALASGELVKAKQFLAALGDTPSADLDSIWLYAVALVYSNESTRASQILDTALKARGSSTRLLLVRGSVARDRGQLPEAADFFERALKGAPDNARLMVELASVRLRQNDTKGAGELLIKALDSDVRKTLDAAEEARANMLRGSLAAAGHDLKNAEAAYERAVALDPNSTPVRVAYGEFRLQRLEWDKAARQFEAAIQLTASAPAYAGAARAYLGQNRLLEADKAINEAVAREATNASYLYLQGRVADAIGKAEEAYRKYEAALKAKPDLVEALAAQGLVWYSRNDKASAQEKLDAALKVPAGGLTALENEAIGELALALGHREKAREAYTRALQIDPDDPNAHAGVGKALAAQGEVAAARKQMEAALVQLDSDASLQYEYGSLLRRMGQSDAALQSFRKAVKLDSKDARYRTRLGGILVERGDLEEAELQLREAVAMNDRHAEALYFLARALAGRKNLGEAMDVMKKAVEIEPDNPEFHYHLGLIFEKGLQVRDAIETFTRAIEKGSRNADTYEHLGVNLMVENRFPEAVKSFRKAVELEPRRPRLWALVGDAEQQSGDVDGAIRDFQRALAQDPNLPAVWTKLGIAYKDKDCRGCRTKAVDALQRATRVDPTDALAHHQLGYIFKDDGRRKEAIAEFRRYLDLRPDAGDSPNVQDDIYYLQEESRRTP
jgi:cellulose synthase operon protein C